MVTRMARRDAARGQGESLQKRPGPISEAGSHSNINSTVDRSAQLPDDKGVELRLNYNGAENIPMWAMMIFTMLLA